MDNRVKDFAENLKTLRTENKLLQKELAERLGVSQQCVSEWERGNADPTMTSLWDIADFFGISIDVLCGRKEW